MKNKEVTLNPKNNGLQNGLQFNPTLSIDGTLHAAEISRLKKENAHLLRESDILATGIIERNAIIAELIVELDVLKMELAELSARNHL